MALRLWTSGIARRVTPLLPQWVKEWPTPASPSEKQKHKTKQHGYSAPVSVTFCEIRVLAVVTEVRVSWGDHPGPGWAPTQWQVSLQQQAEGEGTQAHRKAVQRRWQRLGWLAVSQTPRAVGASSRERGLVAQVPAQRLRGTALPTPRRRPLASQLWGDKSSVIWSHWLGGNVCRSPRKQTQPWDTKRNKTHFWDVMKHLKNSVKDFVSL